MEIVMFVLILAGFAAWAFAVVSWLMALQHRKPEVPISALLLSGFKAFDSDNFTEVGQQHQRRFMLGFAVFFLLVFLGIAAGIAASSMQ